MRAPRLPAGLVSLLLRATVKRNLAREHSPERMRARLERMSRRLFRLPAGLAEEETALAAGGAEVPALRLSPESAAPGVLLYFHGGAYIAGSPRTHRHLAGRIAKAAGIAAVLPDYALAPERPFPAAVEDALTAYRALLERGEAPERIALAGDSAGGGLAAALLLAAEAEGLPAPGALVAFSPWADMTGRADSLAENARTDPMLPAERLGDVVEMVLQGADPADPRASPALGRFRHPPPALLYASRDEILADDAEALGRALEAGGGRVTLRLEHRLPHAWPVLAGLLRAGDRDAEAAGRFLAETLPRP